MDTKLTLKLDSRAIENAKEFAKKNHTSLSKIVETYFRLLTESGNSSSPDITPLVKELSGIIDIADDFDYKWFRADRLVAKYKS